MTKKTFIMDSVKTIAGTLLIALGLQFLAYPIINHHIGSNEFGVVLTVYTIITITSVVLGNTLNNIRLINVSIYNPNYYYSKFTLILFISILIESIALTFVFLYFFDLNVVEIILLIMLNTLMCLRIYLNVFFRMTLKYNQILYIAIFQFVGLLMGLYLYSLTRNWIICFIVSELCATGYTLFKLRGLKRSEIEITENYIVRDYVMLLSTNSLNNLNLYLDRLILLPIIGGTAVTISFLSTFIGKMLATFLYPINNVVLSYISVNESGDIKQQYLRTNIFAIISLCAVMILCYPITIIIVSTLYNMDSNLYSKYIILGNIGVLFNAICIMIQTLNTKHASITLQANFMTIHTIVFIVLTIFMTIVYGLDGFFWTTLFGNVIKYVILNVIGLKSKMTTEKDD
ncbi:capsular biosynthesis protein [Staphylococcus sp. SS251]|nr:capsular biosynthesis protein [Staphylococcus singaporensis]MBE5672542.1 capsular biosynthesis protein [Staphylococcus singaporensis]MBE5677707.1 capsular biosynthesis protein [Staphylococcus singaporensis]